MPYKNKESYRQWRLKNIEKVREYARNYHRSYDKEWKKGLLRGKRQKSVTTAENVKRRRRELREYYNRKNREYKLKCRENALRVLGAKCNICGNNDIRVLQIDHMKNNGSYERRFSRTTMYRKITSMNLSELKSEYQVLCANCHAIKTYHNSQF